MRIGDNPNLKILAQRVQKQLHIITPKALQKRLERKAQQLSTQTWVALFSLAKESGVQYLRVLNSLPEEKQALIRTTLTNSSFGRTEMREIPSEDTFTKKEKSELTILINTLIQDSVLKKRCVDLLRAGSSYDRVYREATVILEYRIRKIAGIKEKMKPADLVAKAINPNRDKAILKIGKDNAEQQGFFEIYHGIVLAFRDTVHHELIDSLYRTDALKFCAFIDMLLGLLEKSELCSGQQKN